MGLARADNTINERGSHHDKEIIREKNKVPMTITLSTGYDVEFNLCEVNKGLLHLARALFGEIVIGTAKRTAKKADKFSWDMAAKAVYEETAAIVKGMDTDAMKSLLHAIIWDVYCREAGKLGKKINKKYAL